MTMLKLCDLTLTQDYFSYLPSQQASLPCAAAALASLDTGHDP